MTVARTTVAARINGPDQAPRAGTTAALRLVASLNGEAAGLDPATFALLQGRREDPVPAHGWWVKALRPNTDIAPTNNFYELATMVPGRGQVVSRFAAPASPAASALTAQLTIPADGSPFTINLASATAFAAATPTAPKMATIVTGSRPQDRVVVEYTGKTATTLTGCTTYATSGTYAIGTAVEQAYSVGELLVDPPVGLPTTVSQLLGDHLVDALDAHDASAVSFLPAGGLASTDVQAAVAELGTTKVAGTGTTRITVSATAPDNPQTGDIWVEPGAGGSGGGGSAVFTLERMVDVWNSQTDPASITDWVPIILALYAAGKRRLWVGQYLPCTSMLDLTNYVSLCIEGPAGLGWLATAGDRPAAGLVYKNAGSADFVRLHGSRSVQLKNLGVFYDNPGYSGRLINARGNAGNLAASGTEIESCTVGAWALDVFSAFACLALGNTVGVRVAKTFILGAQHCVRGYDLAGDSVSNANSFEDVCFDRFTESAFCNPGLQNHFRNCTWEFSTAALDARGIDTDIACRSHFDIDAGAFWDPNPNGTNTQIPVRLGSTAIWEMASFENVFFDVFPGLALDLDGGAGGPANINVERCAFQAYVPTVAPALVDLHSSTPYAKTFRWGGNRVALASPTNYILNKPGHNFIDLDV